MHEQTINLGAEVKAVSTSQRYRDVRQVLWVVLFLNYAVCALKLIVGYLAHSASMVADGFHSLSDGSSNIVGLVGMGMAAQPVDKDHPYGHGKFETLTAIGIAAMLFFVAIEILKSTWEKLWNPVVPSVGAVQFAVMIGTMGINFLVTRYESGRGKALKSEVLTSDAAHTMTDLYVSASVLVSLLAVKLGFPIVDLLASLVIAVLIIKAGVEIVSASSRVLCDAAVLDPDEVATVVGQIDGVVGCSKIRTRGREDQTYLDLHVQVNKELNLEGVHSLSHEIDKSVRQHFANVAETMVHVEPAAERLADDQ
ncbi:MAG: cation diffusion facilitator family transporter [Bacillota bacterium]